MKPEEYLKVWIKENYPFAKYTNSLSLKWVAKFAKDYHEFKSKK